MVTRWAGFANAPHSASLGTQPMVKVPGVIRTYFCPSFLLTRTEPCVAMTIVVEGAFTGGGFTAGGAGVGVGGSTAWAFATITGCLIAIGVASGLRRET